MQELQLKKISFQLTEDHPISFEQVSFFKNAVQISTEPTVLQMVENNLLLLKGKQNYVVINNCVYLPI